MDKRHPLVTWGLTIAPLFLLAGNSDIYAADMLSPDSPWLSGNWGGKRQQWADQGIDVGMFYLSESANNVHGGYDTRNETATSDQTAVIINYALLKSFGIDGTWSLAVTNRNNHHLLSTDRLNDPRGPATNLSQEVWGSGSFTRISHLTYEQRLFDQHLSVRVGRMSPTEEYFPDPHACDFQVLQNCGTVPGNSGIWYGWPVATWGLSTTWHITPDVYMKAGVYQQNPEDLEKSRAWSFSFKGGKGEIYPVLLGYTPSLGEHRYTGNYFIGAFYSNVKSPDVYEGGQGGAQSLNPAAGFKQRNDRQSAWLYASQQVSGPGNGNPQGLHVFTNAEINNPETSIIHYLYGGGFYYNGFFKSRAQDVLGFATTVIHINERWAKNLEINNVAQGYDSDDTRYFPSTSQEINSELFYRWQATRAVYVQPNIQYYHHPGAVNAVDDAVVLGLRVGVSL